MPSNDPLIVSSVYLWTTNGVKGLSNHLSIVNPQDIESFNILKDALPQLYMVVVALMVLSSHHQTCRKGQKVCVSYNGSATVIMKNRPSDVMDGDLFREFVRISIRATAAMTVAVGALAMPIPTGRTRSTALLSRRIMGDGSRFGGEDPSLPCVGGLHRSVGFPRP
jgi:hypothetical protein